MNWKPIEDYPNYEISDCGMVMNSRGHILKPATTIHGYEFIYLFNNGKKKFCTIHRLVAIAFIPNIDNKPQVDHIDRCKTNNHISNLRWATPSENMQNQGIHCDNKLGIQYICYHKSKNRYKFEKIISGKTIQKTFKTLEEAIEFKKSLPKIGL